MAIRVQGGVSASVSSKMLMFTIGAALSVPIAAHAQIEALSDQTSTPIPGAGHDYIHLFSETVNPANGSLSVKVGTPVPSGRRITLPFGFSYNAGSVNHLQDSNGVLNWIDNAAYLATGGWSYTMPMLSNLQVQEKTPGFGGPGSRCVFWTNYVFQDPSGGAHPLYISPEPGPTNACPYAVPIVPQQQLTGGDDYYRAVLTSTTSNLLVADADGTVYTFPPYTGQHSDGGLAGTSLPSLIEDRNGNEITISDLNSGAFNVTDTLGRTSIASSGFGSTGNTVSIAGLTNPYTVTWGTASANYTVGYQQVLADNYCYLIPTVSSTRNVITGIQLPNGTSYTFTYDPVYGVVNKITYPTGGYVSYTWGLNPLSEFANYNDQNGGLNSCEYYYGSLVVTHRYVSFDGSTIAQQQDFTYGPTNFGSHTFKTTTVKTTDNVSGAVYSTIYTYDYTVSPDQPNTASYFAAQIPVESSVVTKNSAGTTLSTVTKTWLDQYELASQSTNLNGQVSETDYKYGNGAQVTEQDDYDFGSGSRGALLRATCTTYKSFSSTPIFSSEASIFDKPSSVVVSSSLCNAPTTISETDYLYDGQSSLGSVSSTDHDDTKYPYTVTSPRGNATTVTKKCLQSCSNAVSTYTYDETGQVASITDPNANMTSFSFSDSPSGGNPAGNSNAYLTQITRPTTNGVAHVTKYQYNYSSGDLSKSTDENSQTSDYTYSDSLGRLTQIQGPADPNNGGQRPTTTYTYDDTVGAPKVTTAVLLNTSGTSETTQQLTDGMGHTIRTEIVNDPSGPDYTDTTYDGLGRVWRQTTPYRSTGDATYGYTTTTFDALNRPLSATHLDGSAQLWSYNANQTTSTDESGRVWKRTSDGLGRLTQVLEPDGSSTIGSTPSLETDYQYDSLGNLSRVDQWGGAHGKPGERVRTFLYDSLSRLVDGCNPETIATASVCTSTGPWSNLYSYDKNGNVLSNTDARGTIIQYVYDPLNRVQAATNAYGTPNACYWYDNGTPSSLPTGCPAPPPPGQFMGSNLIGRLAGVWTSDGKTATAFTYDTSGRTTNQYFCTPSNCGSGFFSISAKFDLGGDVTDLTYPDGRHLVQSFDAVRHLTSINYADYGGQTVNYNYLSSAAYSADGAPATMATGNGLTTTWSRNSRLQPTEIQIKNSASTKLFDRQYCYGPPSPISGSNCSNLGVTDNGNIFQIPDILNSNNTQTLTYDNQNRLLSFHNGGGDRSQTYTIDSFGNMDQSGTLSSALIFNGNNRDSGTVIQYDAAGNATNVSNGVTWTPYVYDAFGRIANINSGASTYTYDVGGNRVRKDSGGSWTEYLMFGGAIIAENHPNSGNGQWTDYIFAGGTRLAESTTGNPTSPSTTTTYYGGDQLGSSRILTNGSGGVVESYEYYPFGQGAAPDATNHYLFTGKERDTESGNDYFGARYYASSMGRFLSPDWSAKIEPVPYAKLGNPQSLNLYSYVWNNPLSRNDPDGHYTTSCTSSDISKCDANTQNTEKARQEALKSSDPKVVAAAKAYGAYGEKNGVTVAFQEKGDSYNTFAKDASGKVTGVNVVLNSTTLSGINNADANSAGHVMALADVAHEGSHVGTRMDLINHNFNPKFNLTNRQSEIRAYGVTNAIVGPSPWNVVGPDHQPADLGTEEGINKYLNSLPPNPEEPLDAPMYTPPQ